MADTPDMSRTRAGSSPAIPKAIIEAVAQVPQTVAQAVAAVSESTAQGQATTQHESGKTRRWAVGTQIGIGVAILTGLAILGGWVKDVHMSGASDGSTQMQLLDHGRRLDGIETRTGKVEERTGILERKVDTISTHLDDYIQYSSGHSAAEIHQWTRGPKG